MRFRRTALLLTTLALLAAGCGGGDGGTDPGSDPLASDAAEDLTPANQLVAQVASFDLAVGQDQRLLVGLFTGQREIIGGGDVRVRIGRIPDGDTTSDTQVQMTEAVDATFLPVPGKEPEQLPEQPAPLEGSGAGVYAAEVDLPEAGTWGVQVEVELDGEPVTATAVFPVAEEHGVPAVGDPAPSVDNPTVDDDVPPAALDSRAQGDDAEVPDPELHDASIAEVLEAGRPMVVVVSTPVYCVSQFCGPITEAIAAMSEQYGDRAEFVHLEVWADFEAQELNPAAEAWIFDPETGGNEPWVFLVGADGTIQQRWDNVLDAEELTNLLEELPTA